MPTISASVGIKNHVDLTGETVSLSLNRFHKNQEINERPTSVRSVVQVSRCRTIRTSAGTEPRLQPKYSVGAPLKKPSFSRNHSKRSENTRKKLKQVVSPVLEGIKV